MNETKICRKCLIEQPITNFVKHPSTKDKRQNQCRTCRQAATAVYRRLNDNLCTKKYEKTKKGFLVRTYRNMLSRVKGILKRKAHLYKGLEILDKGVFYDWSLNDIHFNEIFNAWEKTNYNRNLSPSIDRIESDKGYVLENMQWLTQLQNSMKATAGRKKKVL